jgi:hypothetical protein
MIDESANPAMFELTSLYESLLVRVTKGKAIIEEEQRKQNPDMNFIQSCNALMDALKALRVQVSTCIAVLDDQMDVICEEGSTLVIARHSDLQALETIRNAAQYVEMIMEKRPTTLVTGDKPWNLVFKQINTVKT